jgi:serine/threonine protein kinase
MIREAKICGNIEHRNIVRVYDMLMAEGSMCIIMELLEGETLKTLLGREGRLDVERAKKIMSMTADALARAHSLNIVHRDIKPSNIFLTVQSGIRDFVKLLDFGIAFTRGAGRPSGEDMVMGTPPYSPPEQITSREPTPASDIYSLGCVAYEMLTGRTPFASADMQEVLEGQLHREPRPVTALRPEVPEKLGGVIMKMLEKNPEDRYSDAFDLLYTMKNMDLYRSGADEEEVPPGEITTQEVFVFDTPTAGPWGSYFKKAELDSEDTGPSQSLVRGIEAVTELSELERRTQEIVKKMERLENKRRTYKRNIGNAVAILGMDLSRTRTEGAKVKIQYLKTVSERDYMAQQMDGIETRLVALYENRRRLGVQAAGDEEMALLSQAARTARRLKDLTARADALHSSRQRFMENVRDMKVQILQLVASIAEVEGDYGKDYEVYRKMLDEVAGRGEKLRQDAAQAAYEVGKQKH